MTQPIREFRMHFSTPETRASLILRLRDGGDVLAWSEFESVYAPVIRRVAGRRGLQHADAENVVQEVLLRVAKSVSTWLDNLQRGPFRAWLIRIARNEAARMLSQPATRPLGGSLDSELIPTASEAERELSTELDRESQREIFLWAAEQVRSAVAEQTWMAFWLTHVEGLSVEDAARQLGVKTGNIYFGRCRVMNRLRVAVRQFEEP